MLVFQFVAYGGDVISFPQFAPSTRNWTPATPALSEAVAESPITAETVASLVGLVIDTVDRFCTVLLLTVTSTGSEIAWFPAASRATAISVCVPLEEVVVFQDIEYGATVSSAPEFAPSNLNWTPAIPRLDDALAETVTVDDTVEPPAGAVMEIVSGGTVFVRLKLAGVATPLTAAVTE